MKIYDIVWNNNIIYIAERMILEKLSHPFIVKLHYAF